jgi:hypothetical protein
LLASDPHASTAHHAVVVGGQETKTFKKQKEAADWAIAQNYKPIHVPRADICKTAIVQIIGDTTRSDWTAPSLRPQLRSVFSTE